ncbi:hypothetical protein [Maritalea sp.]|uniref:hypothetical protein n=1 Tax=Maritalea sp. TaxID=2003361 RepID=UPI003EF96A52
MKNKAAVEFLKLFGVYAVAIIMIAALGFHIYVSQRYAGIPADEIWSFWPKGSSYAGWVAQAAFWLSAIFAAYLAYARTFELREANKTKRVELDLDRTAKAIDKVCNESLTMQAVGFYELRSLLITRPKLRGVCTEAAANYIEEHSEKLLTKQKLEKTDTVRHMALAIELITGANKFSGSKYRIPKAVLNNTTFELSFDKIQFVLCYIARCRFISIEFSWMKIYNAIFEETIYFQDCTFTDVMFDPIRFNKDDWQIEFKGCSGEIEIGGKTFKLSPSKVTVVTAADVKTRATYDFRRDF